MPLAPVRALAANERSATQAEIRRATLAAHGDVERLDAQSLKELESLYRQAAADLAGRIAAHAGPDGNIALQELQSALSQVNARLRELSQARDTLLTQSLETAADLGVRPYTAVAGAAVLDMAGAMRVSNEALNFVRHFVAADGLQLSDRIWRIDRGARDAVVNAIEMAVIQGHGASQAAREFLARGAPVPAEISDKVGAASAGAIGKTVSEQLVTGTGAPMDNAMRLFRTEINRAHGEAYMMGGQGTAGFAGWRYLLSPAHLKPDVCLRAGTLVVTDGGETPIETIRVGDRVLTHRGRLKPVTQTYRSATGRSVLVRLCFPAENSRTRAVVMTPNHPVLTPSGWTSAGDLRTGHRVIVASRERSSSSPRRVAGADHTEAPDSRKTASRCAARNNGQELCDECGQWARRRRRIEGRDDQRPTYLPMPDAAMRPSFCCPHSNEDYPHAAGRAITTVGILLSVETSRGGASRNLGSSSRQDAGHRQASNISRLCDSLLRRTIYRMTDTLRVWWRALRDNSSWNRTHVPVFGLASAAPGMSYGMSDSQFRFVCREPSIERNSGDCRNAFPPFACRGPTAQAWGEGGHHSVRMIDLASLKNISFSTAHATVDIVPTPGEVVFNIGVEADHSYVANGVVVHNCDLLSTQNLYGLGPGVYPSREQTPWPAHPNTISFIEVVFESEITDADRAGKETTLQALKRLPPEQRRGVLGKARADGWSETDAAQRAVRGHLRSRYGDAVLTPLSVARKVATPLAGQAGRAGAGAILGAAMTDAYEVARAGGKHGRWYRIYQEHGDRQIEKSIRSFQALIREHEGWIADPFSKLPRTADATEARRLVEVGWPEDIQRHRELIDILKGILRERRK